MLYYSDAYLENFQIMGAGSNYFLMGSVLHKTGQKSVGHDLFSLDKLRD